MKKKASAIGIAQDRIVQTKAVLLTIDVRGKAVAD